MPFYSFIITIIIMYLKMNIGIFQINRLRNYWSDFQVVFCKTVSVVQRKFKFGEIIWWSSL